MEEKVMARVCPNCYRVYPKSQKKCDTCNCLLRPVFFREEGKERRKHGKAP